VHDVTYVQTTFPLKQPLFNHEPDDLTLVPPPPRHLNLQQELPTPAKLLPRAHIIGVDIGIDIVLVVLVIVLESFSVLIMTVRELLASGWITACMPHGEHGLHVSEHVHRTHYIHVACIAFATLATDIFGYQCLVGP
jgi:hypothetical protein